VQGDPDQGVVGKIDGADYFDGSGDRIQLPQVFTDENEFTMEAWIHAESGARYFLSQWSSSNGAFFQIWNNNQLQFYINGNQRGQTSISINEWHHVVGTFDGSTARLYVDSELEATSSSGVPSWPSENMYISDRSTGGREFHGIIDEVRISTIGRDIYWINSSYINQKNTSSFYIIGNQQVFNNPPYKPHNPYPENGSLNVSLNITLSWIGGDPDGDPVTYTIYFGNNSPPPKVVDNQTNTSYKPNMLEINTTYYWKIVAFDDLSLSNRSSIWWFNTGDNQPPFKPILRSASTFGKSDIELKFSANTTDPDGDDIFYMWDWDDNLSGKWIGPYHSGTNITTNHSWDEPGEYNIKVKAKDSKGSESFWSDKIKLIIEDTPPTVKIKKPKSGAIYLADDFLCKFISNIIIGPITIEVSASDNISGVNKVEFYIENVLQKTDTTKPYKWRWIESGNILNLFKIKIIVYDNAENTAISNMNIIRFF
jgi:hypothetical protein